MIVRVEQVLWTLSYLDDLDADFARFYRREWWEHSGPRFFARALRLMTYGGTLAAQVEHDLRVEQEQREADPEPADDVPDILDALDARDMVGLVEVG